MELSIIELEEKIYSSVTKKYFKEVSSSFYNGNYRAAIVTLYSVVITDLILKLQELANDFGDSKAEGILKRLTKFKDESNSYSKWESKLIEELHDHMQFFELGLSHNLSTLRDIRNLCAHPSASIDDKLYQPNKYIVQGLIVNVLKGLLCRPAFFSEKIKEKLMDLLSNFTNDKFTDETLKYEFEYLLKHKYFTHINENISKYLFKNFWKLTFKKNDDEINKRKRGQFVILENLLEKYTLEIYDDIQYNIDHYSRNIDNLDARTNFLLFLIINKHQEIYNSLILNVQSKLIIDSILNENHLLDILHIQKHSGIEEHFEFVVDRFVNNLSHIERLKLADYVFACIDIIKYYKEIEEKDDTILFFVINLYVQVPSHQGYIVSDYIFENIIKYFLKYFEKKHLEYLIEKSNLNPQNCGRKRQLNDHYEVFKHIRQNNIDIDPEFLKESTNFFWRIDLDEEIHVEEVDDFPF